QLMARASDDYGNLKPAPSDWPYIERAHSLAALYLSALRRRDRETLAALHLPGMEEREKATWLRPLIHFLLDDAKSPFADVRRNASNQSIVLITRGERFEGDTSATLCFCRRADCTARWPIASWDADNLPSRPYACTTFGTYV